MNPKGVALIIHFQTLPKVLGTKEFEHLERRKTKHIPYNSILWNACINKN